MKCPECVAAGRRSRVNDSMTSLVLPIPAQSYWDEDGKHHYHDASTRFTGYSCSNGHRWQESGGGTCWCGWSSVPYSFEEPQNEHSANKEEK